MKIIASFITAISTYSKIPMPQKVFKNEDLRYVFAFFPLVGVVIGLIVTGGWYLLCSYDFNLIIRSCFILAVPLLITGGIHVDGYMDTRDALGSYLDKDKKLEIMKDSHIGGGAVSSLALYGLIYFGAISCIDTNSKIVYISLGFVLSRGISSLFVVHGPLAKPTGMLAFMQGQADKVICTITGLVYVLASLAGMYYCVGYYAIVCAILQLIVVCYVYTVSKRQLGGINGDIAGYLVLVSQLMTAMVAIAMRG